MDEIFNMLSSSARIDKSKRQAKKKKQRPKLPSAPDSPFDDGGEDHGSGNESGEEHGQGKSRDRTGKRDTSKEKQLQVHREQIAAFRRSMAIRLGNKHDPDTPDPIASFQDISAPQWWNPETTYQYHPLFSSCLKAMLQNIEAGRWKEPTAIQMQAIPALLHRRDFIGAAPTGSGKSGAFLIPALLLSSAATYVFYGSNNNKNLLVDEDEDQKQPASKSQKKKKHKQKQNKKQKHQPSRQGEIRSLVVAPTLELAAQLHREVERLGLGKPGGVSSLLLSKSNAPNVLGGTAGGKNGLDVMVTTPLRLVDALEKGLKLDAVRLIVSDEADRLLDAADGSRKESRRKSHDNDSSSSSSDEDDNSSDESEDAPVKHKAKKNKSSQKNHVHPQPSSGSSQTKSFLAQMDIILSEIPHTAVRALFSATVTPMVRSLAESALRNPVDVTIAAPGTFGGANTDIDQQLMFVGREEGKLLAMRQLAQRGQLKPPVIVFCQSQERAQALFAELLYDGMHVDVIHAGRSKSSRDNAVAKFRRGDTWVLICTDLVARGVDFRAVNMVINYDLPASGITYVHRIGRTGRAGRKGKAITLFTEADFDNLRTIANVMKQSGCEVEPWMLSMKKSNNRNDKNTNPHRPYISTTPKYDRIKRKKNRQMVQDSIHKKRKRENPGDSNKDE